MQIFSPFISKIFNKSIGNANLSDDVILGDITPVYQKNNRNKVNYRPASVLPALPEIFEKVFTTKFTKMLVARC